MAKKKTPRKNEPPTVLFKAEEDRVKERVDSDDIEIDDFQERVLFHMFDNSMRNRFQLGSIQIMLLVICILLTLHFFGWIAALVIGIVLGVIVLISLMVALAPRLDPEDMDFLHDDEHEPRDNQDD